MGITIETEGYKMGARRETDGNGSVSNGNKRQIALKMLEILFLNTLQTKVIMMILLRLTVKKIHN